MHAEGAGVHGEPDGAPAARANAAAHRAATLVVLAEYVRAPGWAGVGPIGPEASPAPPPWTPSFSPGVGPVVASPRYAASLGHGRPRGADLNPTLTSAAPLSVGVRISPGAILARSNVDSSQFVGTPRVVSMPSSPLVGASPGGSVPPQTPLFNPLAGVQSPPALGAAGGGFGAAAAAQLQQGQGGFSIGRAERGDRSRCSPQKAVIQEQS